MTLKILPVNDLIILRVFFVFGNTFLLTNVPNIILRSVFLNRLASTKMGCDRLQIPNKAFQRLAASHSYGQH